MKKNQRIVLRNEWKVQNKLNSGGFADVFKAVGTDQTTVVVKFIPKEPGASRELLFVSLSGSPNIIPIIDSGEWKNYYIIVMPMAEKSLRQYMLASKEKLPVNETESILIDIAEALASLSSDVVHRDIKPENVLFLNGHWCLADFGIARYAEATTDSNTRKFAITPPYAAPEQWRLERATNATDVYAFGVMAYELIRGRLPFEGPDFREQHLNQPAPSLLDCPPKLASLIQECLFKTPNSRPTAANILARLKSISQTASPAVGRLQAVNQFVVESQAKNDARISVEESRNQQRSELFTVADKVLREIQNSIVEQAIGAASATTVSSVRGLILKLGNGTLRIEPVQSAPNNCLAAHNYDSPFDVVAYSTIAVNKPMDHYGYEGRAHSLWYCDAYEAGVYRWYELAFMIFPSIPERSTIDPFSLPPIDHLAAEAFSPVMGVRQLAWQPVPFDQGQEDQFFERWLNWFAQAVDGSLNMPRTLPEQSGGWFRKQNRQK